MTKLQTSSLRWASNLLVVVLTILATFVLPSVAMACETADDAKPDSECVVMEREGVRGVWFNLPAATEIARLKESVPVLQEQIEKLEEIGVIRGDQAVLYARAAAGMAETLKEERTATAVIVKAKRRALKERDAAREELGAWYRSPWLWFGAGVAVTALGGGAVILALD